MRGMRRGIDETGTGFPRVLRPALAGIALALVGCGNLSLVGSLRQENAGELRFSPSTAAIPLNTSCTLTVLGGFFPYTLVSGAVNPLGDNTWQFPGKTSISAEWEDFPIQVRDWAQNTVTVVVRVYATGPVLNVAEVTLPEGIGWTFTVSGGASPYSWNLEGVYQATGSSYNFLPALQGTYVVDVVDSLGASKEAIVTVVPDTIGIDPLSITPLSAVVLPGATITLTALGGDGAYVFSALDGGAIGGTNPATFTAPGTIGTYTIELADGSAGAPVSAEVIVTATGTLPVLFPGSVNVSAIDEEIQFSASGGSPPYAFSTNKPAGSIDPVTGLYRQLVPGNVVVTVKDADGLTDHTLVRWNP